MASLEWLVKDTQPGDILFLHYSGHGTSILDRNNGATPPKYLDNPPS